MATRNKYRELSLGPSEPITRRNSVQGMLVVSDQISPITAQRTLLLQRIDIEGPAKTALKAKLTRKRRAKTNSGATGEAAAFPGSAATNG